MTEEILKEKIPGAAHFTWAEALWLTQWQIYVTPPILVYENIIKTASVLEQVRVYFGRPVHVTSWYRPPFYNRIIKGAPGSAHCEGLAVDFSVNGMECDAVRSMLIKKLAVWSCRMEDLPGSNWVHIDLRQPGQSGRYFKP